MELVSSTNLKKRKLASTSSRESTSRPCQSNISRKLDTTKSAIQNIGRLSGDKNTKSMSSIGRKGSTDRMDISGDVQTVPEPDYSDEEEFLESPPPRKMVKVKRPIVIDDDSS